MTPQRNANLAVVLVDPRNPLNIGAAARAMSNFGFFDLRLVNPYDVAFREAVSAVGAGKVMEEARVYATVAEAVADCMLVVGATGLGHRQPQHPLWRLELAARQLRRHLEGERAALLFGSEKFGLGNDHVSHCHFLLRIPTRAEHESMNLAQAVAVCLYELIRSPQAARRQVEGVKRAQGAEVERFTELLGDLLEESGYADFEYSKSAAEKTHRLVRRLNLQARDVSVWTGMLRQILWKVRNPG
jgi:TrmH family RNA methyltransferase